MEYETQSHRKDLIALHPILIVKCRKRLLKEHLGEFVKRMAFDIAFRSDFHTEEI